MTADTVTQVCVYVGFFLLMWKHALEKMWRDLWEEEFLSRIHKEKMQRN